MISQRCKMSIPLNHWPIVDKALSLCYIYLVGFETEIKGIGQMVWQGSPKPLAGVRFSHHLFLFLLESLDFTGFQAYFLLKKAFKYAFMAFKTSAKPTNTARSRSQWLPISPPQFLCPNNKTFALLKCLYTLIESDRPTEEDVADIMNQSPIVEPAARKRRRRKW